MLSINMRIFKTVLLLIAFVFNVQCLPVGNEASNESLESSTSLAPPLDPTIDHYDQRQNGTENYRIHVDGVIFVVAPVEALLLAGATGNESNLSILDVAKPSLDKPKPEAEEISKPPALPKSTHRSGLRLANLIVPLLRRIRQE